MKFQPLEDKLAELLTETTNQILDNNLKDVTQYIEYQIIKKLKEN